ncbi:hypothetical protein ACI3E1_07230 [Ligilactobacillus sp. LYQ139]|uniref:hypothetical protein n=1 Tax=Ligilactobacillus sp. LYQ139 TaxID=3378800 RepID=UPI003854B838
MNNILLFFGILDCTCLALFEVAFIYLVWHAKHTVKEFRDHNCGLDLTNTTYSAMVERIGMEMIMPLKVIMITGLFVFMAICMVGLIASIFLSFNAFLVLILATLCLGSLLLTGSKAIKVNLSLKKQFLALVS